VFANEVRGQPGDEELKTELGSQVALLIRYSQEQLKTSPRDVMTELRLGTPSIELNPSTGQTTGASAGIPADVNTIVVGVWMLQPGEEMIVARRLREVLEKESHG
jgi:L-seryl-tRNA(Ser) seleniumtransferase